MNFISKLESIENKPIFDEHGNSIIKEASIFGAGGRGQRLYKSLSSKGTKILHFFDNDPSKWGKRIDNKEICQFTKDTVDTVDYPIIVSSFVWASSINTQLLNSGLSEKYIYFDFPPKNSKNATSYKEHLTELSQLYDILEDDFSKKTLLGLIKGKSTGDLSYVPIAPYPQYEHTIVRPRKNDIIIDGGAYDGDTVNSYANLVENHCEIHAFEPDIIMYKRLIDNAKDLPAGVCIPVNMGLWHKKGSIHGDNLELGNKDQIEPIIVNVIDIDTYLAENDINCDLIKLDVEGVEMEALLGAQKTIKHQKPSLQICLYHKTDDIFEIPLFLNKLQPDYKMYIGHHSSDGFIETVLYCISKDKKVDLPDTNKTNYTNSFLKTLNKRKEGGFASNF